MNTHCDFPPFIHGQPHRYMDVGSKCVSPMGEGRCQVRSEMEHCSLLPSTSSLCITTHIIGSPWPWHHFIGLIIINLCPEIVFADYSNQSKFREPKTIKVISSLADPRNPSTSAITMENRPGELRVGGVDGRVNCNSIFIRHQEMIFLGSSCLFIVGNATGTR